MVAAMAAAALLSACAHETAPSGRPAAALGTDWSQAELIDVVMTDFRFTPDVLRLRQGRPYRLHLENRGSGVHNISAGSFFKTAAVRADAPVAGAGEAVTGDTVRLAKGETKDVYMIPMTPGSYDFDCSEFLHSLFGMTGNIVVE
jgi:uncharacterized cupredoxin-like copper-binding protein